MTYHRILALFPHEPDDAAASEVSLRPSVPTLARVLMPNQALVELRVVDL